MCDILHDFRQIKVSIAENKNAFHATSTAKISRFWDKNDQKWTKIPLFEQKMLEIGQKSTKKSYFLQFFDV